MGEPIAHVAATGIRTSPRYDLVPLARAQGITVTTGGIQVQRFGPFISWTFANLSTVEPLVLAGVPAQWLPPGGNFYGGPHPYYRNGAEGGRVWFRSSGEVGTTGPLSIAEMSLLLPARDQAWPTAPPL